MPGVQSAHPPIPAELQWLSALWKSALCHSHYLGLGNTQENPCSSALFHVTYTAWIPIPWGSSRNNWLGSNFIPQLRLSHSDEGREEGVPGQTPRQTPSDLQPCASLSTSVSLQLWGKRNVLLPLPQSHFKGGFVYWPSEKCKGLKEMPKNPLARMKKEGRGEKRSQRPQGKWEAREDIHF